MTASLVLVRSSDLAAAARFRAELKSGAARHRREAAGVSMRDVARVIGVTGQAVHYWETGRSVPSVAHALAYGRVLAALSRRAA